MDEALLPQAPVRTWRHDILVYGAMAGITVVGSTVLSRYGQDEWAENFTCGAIICALVLRYQRSRLSGIRSAYKRLEDGDLDMGVLLWAVDELRHRRRRPASSHPRGPCPTGLLRAGRGRRLRSRSSVATGLSVARLGAARSALSTASTQLGRQAPRLGTLRPSAVAPGMRRRYVLDRG